MRVNFAQIDAFAQRAFEGNPAAVMPLASWLDDATLLAIAAENNLSETAFIVPITGSDDDGGKGPDFELRWFTPAAEVALCGHATLASGHFVLSADPSRDSISFQTRQAGVLEVSRAGTAYEMALPAWAPAPRQLDDIVSALGVNAVETMWHEKGYPLVIVRDEAAVRAAAPDMAALAKHPVVAIVSARGESADVVSRVFTPFYAIPEDPVTGSAHAVMVPYWAEKLGRDSFSAFQASARGGHVGCRLSDDRVVLTGGCVTVVEGSFLLG